jgi:hypothetical protein
MTVTSTAASAGPFTTNGSTVTFPFGFTALTTGEVQAVRRTGIGGLSVDTPLGGYTVTLNGNQGTSPGGSITYSVAPPAGDPLYILSNPTFTQQTTFANQGAWSPTSMNTALDRAAIRDLKLLDDFASVAADLLQEISDRQSGDITLTTDFDELSLALSDLKREADATASGLGHIVLQSSGIAIPRITPEAYGALGVPFAVDDGPALAAASAAITALGRGVLELYPGRTYPIGSQTAPKVTSNGTYQYGPNTEYPIEFNGCSGPVVLNGNGARIQCLAGKKFGSFNGDGTVLNPTMPYFGTALSSPYFAMIYVHGCTGPVIIRDIELDGNLASLSIGGTWGDTGRQIPATGMQFTNNSGGIAVSNVQSHHHGLDGAGVNGPATSDGGFGSERGYMFGVNAYCNGRQGLSFTGGKGWIFDACSFNWTGKANPGSDTVAAVQSGPCSGVDFEAEGGKKVRDVLLRRCEIVGNSGAGMVQDNTDCDRIVFEDCTFIGTTNYALWPKGPGFVFRRCRIVGTVVNAYGPDASSPQDAILFDRCSFWNADALSPTGTTYSVNNLLIENIGGGEVYFDRCKFVHDRSAAGSFNGSTDQGRFNDCEFHVLQSNAGFYGRVSGPRTLFKEVGAGLHAAVPNGGRYDPFRSVNSSGEALDTWRYEGSLNGNVRTTYAATLDRATNTRIGPPASAPPTTGAHVLGERVLNSAPASAGPIGWVCTVAGTPGTWKAYGTIA